MSYGEPDDEFNTFIAGVDAALERQFGPNHQEILGGGTLIASIWWDWLERPLRRVTDGR